MAYFTQRGMRVANQKPDAPGARVPSGRAITPPPTKLCAKCMTSSVNGPTRTKHRPRKWSSGLQHVATS
jgi:hypothetical protein